MFCSFLLLGVVVAVHCLFVIILRYMEDGKAMGRHIRKVLWFGFPDKNMVTGQCDRKVTLELKNIFRGFMDIKY